MTRQPRPSVWHLCRFRERFELADDVRFCRKGPLLYVRDFVTASDDESSTCLRQFDALTRHRNALELIGAFALLRRAASARSRAFRGYLLTADNRPMTDAEIARTILFCDPRRAARILKALADAGLIEQVICPIFDLSQNEVPPKKRSKSLRNKAKAAKRISGRKNSVSREGSENLGRARTPLRAKKKTEITMDKGNENKPLPSEPPRSTSGGSASPNASGPRRDGGPGIVKLADVLPRALDRLTAGYALRADDFASEIFGLLQCPFAPDTLDGRRELGNFRAALRAAIDAGLSPSQIEQCIGKARADAGRIGRSRKRYYANDGSPEQYWRFLWGKHVGARRRRPAKGVG